MKAYKIIAYILSQLLRLWITAMAAIGMYCPMSALAYAERGYRAVGGEIVPVAIVAGAVWVGMGWLTETLYKEYVAEIRLIRAAKANSRKEKADDERKG